MKQNKRIVTLIITLIFLCSAMAVLAGGKEEEPVKTETAPQTSEMDMEKLKTFDAMVEEKLESFTHTQVTEKLERLDGPKAVSGKKVACLVASEFSESYPGARTFTTVVNVPTAVPSDDTRVLGLSRGIGP